MEDKCAYIFHITNLVNSMKVMSQHRNGRFGFIKEVKENLPEKVTNCSEVGKRSRVTQRREGHVVIMVGEQRTSELWGNLKLMRHCELNKH